IQVIVGLHQLAAAHMGNVAALYTHSTTLRALMIYLDPRPFPEAFSEFGEYKEGQDNVVLLTFEYGQFSGYSTAVGISERERAGRPRKEKSGQQPNWEQPIRGFKGRTCPARPDAKPLTLLEGWGLGRHRRRRQFAGGARCLRSVRRAGGWDSRDDRQQHRGE